MGCMASSPERVAPPPPKPSPLIAAPTKATTPKSLKAEAERVFKLADTSKDGKLDLNELAEITGFAKVCESSLLLRFFYWSLQASSTHPPPPCRWGRV